MRLFQRLVPGVVAAGLIVLAPHDRPRGRAITMTSTRVNSLARLSLLALIAATSVGCTLATPSAPSTSTPTRTTDTFEGSFTFQATTSHQFTVTEPGLVEIRLTVVGPLTTMALGVSVGTWNGSVCTTANIRNDNARVGATALSGTSTAGAYCVSVYDSGNLPSDWTATYTVTVTHP